MRLPNLVSPIDSFTTSDRRILFLMGIIAFVAGYGASQMAHTLPFARVTLGLTAGQMSTAFAVVRAASLPQPNGPGPETLENRDRTSCRF